MRYFPQHVLVCTSTEYCTRPISKHQNSGIFKDPLDTKHKIFIDIMFHVLNWSISLKVVKLNPMNGYYMQQVAVRWHSKTYRKNVACHAGSTKDLRSPSCERR